MRGSLQRFRGPPGQQPLVGVLGPVKGLKQPPFLAAEGKQAEASVLKHSRGLLRLSVGERGAMPPRVLGLLPGAQEGFQAHPWDHGGAGCSPSPLLPWHLPLNPGVPLSPGRPFSPGCPGSPASPRDPAWAPRTSPGRPLSPGGPTGPGRPVGPGCPSRPGRPTAPLAPRGPTNPERKHGRSHNVGQHCRALTEASERGWRQQALTVGTPAGTPALPHGPCRTPPPSALWPAALSFS